MEKTRQIGTYIRPSTNQQDDQHQHDSIKEYVDNNLSPSRVEQFVDIESGSNDDREQFNGRVSKSFRIHSSVDWLLIANSF